MKGKYIIINLWIEQCAYIQKEKRKLFIYTVHIFKFNEVSKFSRKSSLKVRLCYVICYRAEEKRNRKRIFILYWLTEAERCLIFSEKGKNTTF